MKKKTAKKAKPAKKTTKKSAKKSSAKKKSAPAKKAAPKKSKMTLGQPELYIHDSETGPQLCIKIPGTGADGVILPTKKQSELNALHKAWTKEGRNGDFMAYPKAVKWLNSLIAAFSFSRI